jgi:hypothetical protein
MSGLQNRCDECNATPAKKCESCGHGHMFCQVCTQQGHSSSFLCTFCGQMRCETYREKVDGKVCCWTCTVVDPQDRTIARLNPGLTRALILKRVVGVLNELEGMQ